MWTSGENCRSTLPPEIKSPVGMTKVNIKKTKEIKLLNGVF